MRGHLVAKGTDATVADAAVAELQRLGYVDDARYAQRFAEDRRALDGWGPERIERRLRENGVEEDHIAAALAQRDASADRDAALELLGRRFAAPPGTTGSVSGPCGCSSARAMRWSGPTTRCARSSAGRDDGSR